MSAFVYIAGPYAAATTEERVENVRRVGVLSNYALAHGFVPFSVHAQIEAGHFGRDDVPEERERGLQAACAMVRLVGENGGKLWVITRDDWTLSAGSALEVEAFSKVARSSMSLLVSVCKPWAEWVKAVEARR